jgi:3-methyladenine DNA glycosylase AlkD
VPVLRELAAKYHKLSLRELSALLRSPWHEERLLALFILVRRYSRAEPARREAIYRLYTSRTARINNWDLVDCSAEHIVGAHLRDGRRTQLLRLARSKVLWERRIATMATFHYGQAR